MTLTNSYDVEYESGDDGLEDLPDPPRVPVDTNKRPLEVDLKKYRLRFNWRAPDEQKSAYLDDNDGLAPGQSPVWEYRVRVQKKVSGSWTDVEDDTTKNVHYVYHADPTTVVLSDVYRALISSYDREGNESAQALNSNTGTYTTTSSGNALTLEEGGTGGGATEAPNKPNAPTAQRRVKAVFLEWADNDASGNPQSDEAEPIVYEIHAKKSTVAWPINFKSSVTRVGQKDGNSRLVTKYYNGTSKVEFTKKDYLGDGFDFRLVAKSKIGTAFTYASAPSESVRSKPARGPNQVIGNDKPDPPSNVTRTVVGPRLIRWDWIDSDDPTTVRYKIVIQSCATANGTFTNYKTWTPSASFFNFHVPPDLVGKYWKAIVYAQTAPNDAGVRTDSNPAYDPAGGSIVTDFTTGDAKVAPNSPTNITVVRRPKKMNIRWYHEPTEDMGSVKYIVHIIKGNVDFTPSSSTKVDSTFNTSYTSTQYNSSGVLINFTKLDASSTFSIIIVAKNSKGQARSVKVNASPATSLVANNNTTITDGDLIEISANKFIADDGTTSDKIVIADDASSKAMIKFKGKNGFTKFEVKGGGGNVLVSDGYVQFSGGLVAPYQTSNSIPLTATGINGSIGVSANRFYWRGTGGWRWVNIANDGTTVNGGLG